MADTVNYFNETLPQKFTNDASFSSAVNNVFQFEIADAGTWHITSEGVLAGSHDEPDCVVTSDKETFDAILDDPNLAMVKFMEGKLAASDLGLAMQLQQFIS